ncbi:MAG: bifunctional UDP-N-acetylmuramoyl-tripeptide:D-alanyl-D-alanine ligase/alanine racemase [Chitinophagia bacterium]|nr:bifunctional UDP-N-acetylmuramoyl-tripeptide:D-alanyl-D-alanine ligase/alanine racemase [Chitinophagia bacterium]
MVYTVSDIVSILHADSAVVNDHEVEHLLLDSRKAYLPSTSLFVALVSARRNGHDFIGELYERGVRSFIISQPVEASVFSDANFIRVPDTLQALQQLAAHHRSRFSIPVIGITGSNGKTIVKEWLFQLLQSDYNIVRSPKSYNSQIGVPLSIWQLRPHHTLAIFEAGISQPGEMKKLAEMIKPTIGIFTNIGDAHSEGFASQAQKEKEKRKLFVGATLPSKIELIETSATAQGTLLTARIPSSSKQEAPSVLQLEIPFSDQASVQNALTCWELMLHLGYPHQTIAARMQQLTAVDMRLTLKKGINQCVLVNDSYSADVSSLVIALDFLIQQGGALSKTVILSDFLQQAQSDEVLYGQVMDWLQKREISRVIAIGSRIASALEAAAGEKQWALETYATTETFLQTAPQNRFHKEAILIKGARSFAFERIAQVLEQQLHETRLEIDLAALLHNLHQYQHCLSPSTRIMAMVKAFAYGSGATEVASLLQFHKVDYLGVAYADEGVALRSAGITIPIMVMNPEESAFELLIANRLEPVMYSVELLAKFDSWLQKEVISGYPIHLEIDTGLHRLGVATEQAERLSQLLMQTTSFTVQTVFSHLAASEDPLQDSFTRLQYDRFMQTAALLEKNLGYSLIKHIANSAAALRHPPLQLDMVRLGIGLYGVEMAPGLSLLPVATLRTAIAQLRTVEAGETISYNRRTTLTRPSVIGTVRLGYADGYPRALGNGAGKVLVNGQRVPIVGTICMDMFMIDVTDIKEVSVGDEVILFGASLSVQEVAGWAATIPYEILTGISTRVKRVYFQQ